MTDSFHNYETDPPAPASFHSYFPGNSLEIGMRYAARMAVDRARAAGNNPRLGTVTIYFDDNGVGAKWEPKP